MIVSAKTRKYSSTLAATLAADLMDTFHRKMNKVEGVEPTVVWRIKSNQSMTNKYAHRGKKSFINDFIGIRVMLSHIGQLEASSNNIREWASEKKLNELDYHDYFSEPTELGYRSIHIDCSAEAVSSDLQVQGLGIEIQITTYLQNLHAEISHRSSYGNDGDNGIPFDLQKLKQISDHLFHLDGEIGDYFAKTMELKHNDD